jgi:hypothetical protein
VARADIVQWLAGNCDGLAGELRGEVALKDAIAWNYDCRAVSTMAARLLFVVCSFPQES